MSSKKQEEIEISCWGIKVKATNPTVRGIVLICLVLATCLIMAVTLSA